MSHTVSPGFVRAFADSMPEAYRNKYSAEAIASHARVVAGRGDKRANVGIFQSHGGRSGMCVVAADRPGLLSTISAAFVLCGLDVTDAEAYTRRSGAGKDEAVDLFWLRPQDPSQRGSVTTADAERVERLLVDLLEGKADSKAIFEKYPSPAPVGADTVVRFLDDSEGGLATLEVETTDRSGLLLALSHALYQQRVQIVRSEVRTIENRVLDRFTVVELDGAAISRARRLEIQVAVLNAVEPARRTTPPSASP